MKMSASIELLWNMAAQEAIAAEFDRIEPEHFLEALLKFSELPADEMLKQVGGGEVAKQLVSEVETVRDELAGRFVEASTFRRRLRTRLGRGNKPYDGNVMHRSESARQAFDQACILAADAGSETIMPIHLLEVLLSVPTEAVREVFGKAVGPRAPAPSPTPMLDRHGDDLVSMAIEGRLPPADGRTAQRNAVIMALARKDCKSVLLVSDEEKDCRAVVAAVARAVAAQDAGSAMRGKRLFDITAAGGIGDPADAAERMVGLLGEAAKAKEVVLYVPALAAAEDAQGPGRWTGLLKGILAKGSVQCICRTPVALYRGGIERDRDWKRLATAIFVLDIEPGEVPQEI